MDGAQNEGAAHTENWLQKWIAIAESIGISKRSLLEDYYLDEFLTMLDEYNEMHKVERELEVEEVTAEAW